MPKSTLICADQKGSVLLFALLITGMIATLTLSFASSMRTQIQVARDQAASLHADLAAQSGLEYAQRRLMIDPLWDGTLGAPLLYSEGTTFSVIRKEGDESMVLPTEVTLVVEGNQSAAKARFETLLYVNPGDPLLDKAISVLGNVSGSNIKIDGDYLLLDGKGWLWDFRVDLIPNVQMDIRLNDTEEAEEQVKLDMRSLATRNADTSEGYDSDGVKQRGASEDAKDRPHSHRRHFAKTPATSSIQGFLTSSIQDLLLHLRKKQYNVEGVWARSNTSEETFVSLDRIDAPGALHNFSETLYSWAQNQVQEKQPIHAPGWDFSGYLVPDSKIRIFDHITEVADLDIEETAVFLLDPGQGLDLQNVNFRGGLVVWAEPDYDHSGAPRNPIHLSGTNSFGGGTKGLRNIGILAPGSSLTVSGLSRHSITGYTVLHSLAQIQRFQHRGVLIILNSAMDVFDSSFQYDPAIGLNPPDTLTFFGDHPGVRVEMVIESFDAPLPL